MSEDAQQAGGWRLWVSGAQPATLSLAAAPVVVGTLLGRWINQLVANEVRALGGNPTGIPGGIIWWRAIAALVVALGLQAGLNFAKQFARGIGAAGEHNSQPAGDLTPDQARLAAIVSFVAAGAAGVVLSVSVAWWLVLVGVACFVAASVSLSGSRPYADLGLPEVLVFGFFGVVATMGATYVQVGRMTLVSFIAAVPLGFVAVALLEANNLRDLGPDQAAGRPTLAGRIGRPRADWLYLGALMGVAVGVGILAHWRPFALLALLALPLAVTPGRAVLSGAEGRKLLPVVSATSQIQIAVGALVALGVFL